MNEDFKKFRKKWRTPVLIMIGVIMIQQPLVTSATLDSFFDYNGEFRSNYLQMEILYFIPNCIIPLVLGYCTDYLSESSSLIYFTVNLFIAYLFQVIPQDRMVDSELKFVFTLLLSFSGETLVIPLFLYIEKWFGHRKSSQGLCWLQCFYFLGKLVKTLLIARLMEAMKESNNTFEDLNLLLKNIFFAGLLLSLILILLLKHLHNKLSSQSQLHISARIFNIGFLSSLKGLANRRFILLSINSACINTSFFITNQFYTKSNFALDSETLYKLLCVVFGIAFLINFTFLGKYLDKHGTRTSNLIVSSLFYIFSYLCLSLIFISIHASDNLASVLFTLALILIGVGYGLHFGTVYTMLPCLFDRQNLGIAYGFMISLYSLFSVVIYFLFEDIHRESGSEDDTVGFNIYLFSLFFAVIGFACAVILEIIEQNQRTLLGKRNSPIESQEIGDYS